MSFKKNGKSVSLGIVKVGEQFPELKEIAPIQKDGSDDKHPVEPVLEDKDNK